MTICYSFASRSRPGRFFETLDNIIQMSASKNFYIIAKLDVDDPTMNNMQVISRLDDNYPMVIQKWGTSQSKIHAINRSLDDIPDFAILICASDDMRFRTYGFDDMIRKAMPESLDALIHCPDDYAKDRVCTLAVMGRTYYQRDGFIYRDCYYSMFCDDEQTEVAKARGCYIYLPEVNLEHLHYTNERKAVKDELYWRNDTYNKDKVIYEQRKARNFDL